MITSNTNSMAQLLYGYKSKQKSADSQLQIEVYDWTARLNQTLNMSTQKNCPHEYGGLMCGVIPTVRKGLVSAVSTSTSLTLTVDDPTVILDPVTADPVTGNLVNTVDRYENGKIKILSGPFAGLEWYISTLEGTGPDFTINTRKPLPGTRLEGAIVGVTIGCLKTYASCQRNSGGLNRFWGFPLIQSATKVYTNARGIPAI